MSSFVFKNLKNRVAKKGNDLSKFQEILRQKCHQQMSERRRQLFNKGRFGLLSDKDVQETLTEIVRQEFNNLATTEKSEVSLSRKKIINSPLDQDEALKEESEILAEEEQWIVQEYERLMKCEEQMFDIYENEVFCPICQKSFLEEIPDFIICNICGLKIRTDMSLKSFKSNLDFYVNKHSESCIEVPDFSLEFEDSKMFIRISCLACSNLFLVKTSNG